MSTTKEVEEAIDSLGKTALRIKAERDILYDTLKRISGICVEAMERLEDVQP